MENKDYKKPNQEGYDRPHYETAEEYNQARKSSQTQSYHDTQEDSRTQEYSNNGYSDNYGNNPYNSQYYANLGGEMVDSMGNPLKNHSTILIVFAIVEILLCCLSFNTMILGAVALVFAIQASSAYTQGRGVDYRIKSAVSKTLLIIGGVLSVLAVIVSVTISSLVFHLVPDVMHELQTELDFDTLFEELQEEDYYGEYLREEDIPLPEGFQQFTLNGEHYEIPMTYEAFQSMGFDVEDEQFRIATYLMGEGYAEGTSLLDADGNYVGMVRFSNDADKERPLSECTVDLISFENPSAYEDEKEALDLVFADGLTMDCTYEQLEAYFGTPTYQYIEDDGTYSYKNYEWTYYGDEIYQSFCITYVDGIVTDISFEQYGY